MTIDKAEIKAIRRRAERVAKRELDRHEKRERAKYEDPEASKKAILKRRQRWKQKFNTAALLLSAGSVSALALFGTLGNKDIRSPGPIVKIEQPLSEQPQINIDTEKKDSISAGGSRLRLTPLKLMDGTYSTMINESDNQLQTMLKEIESEQHSRLRARVI